MKNVEITDNSIVLKSKAGTITLNANNIAAGIYIENDKGQMNLVSQANMPPYISFYSVDKEGKISGYPYAITINDKGDDLVIQFGNSDPRKSFTRNLKDLCDIEK